jgi:lysophospholipase L1-like esterase
MIGLVMFNAYYFIIKKPQAVLGFIEERSRVPQDSILDDKNYRNSVKEYSSLNDLWKDKKVVVFVGDSITKGYNVMEYFSDKMILNRGIMSDTTLGLLDRMDSTVNNLNVKKLFIMIGYNDLPYRSNTSIVKNISQIVSRARSRKVILQSILPVEPKRKVENLRIAEINRELRQLCVTENCNYLDLHSHFLDEKGDLNPIYFNDGVHPSGRGYFLWTKVTAPLMKDE